MAEREPKDATAVSRDSEKPPMNGNANDDKGEPKKQEDKKKPPGGFDPTPVPNKQVGYTLKITFHRATNLPMADYASLSSDPYVLATLDTGLPTRHKEDPPFQHRTSTIRRCTDPEWQDEWIVANIPSSGFRMKCRVMDEDPQDHDDRLGDAHVAVSHLDEGWKGITERECKIKKRSGSKRAYLIRVFAACVRKRKHLNGNLFVSVEMLGRTEAGSGGRAYTVGPMWYTKHYSPMLGRIANRKVPGEAGEGTEDKKKPEKYKYALFVFLMWVGLALTSDDSFQANQIQLHGPVPEELYHRYVEFKPWVKLMFTTSGIRGFFLSKALHHQHARVYNFSKSTEYGLLGYEPSRDTTLKFLDLVHYDEGGRIFTYVLTLDGLFRFTETGKEFGIDLLSKHTMHSDVSIYIAWSGEFFIRRLKHRHRPTSDEAAVGDGKGDQEAHEKGEEPDNETHPPSDIPGGPPLEIPPKDPAYYELVIDNDSGTYRPNADLLPLLKKFLEYNFPGLHILTLDCQKDEKRMNRMKDEQREKKKVEGDNIVYRQTSRSGSISSSDASDLESMIDREGREETGLGKTVKRDIEARGSARKKHIKSLAKGRSKTEGGDAEVNDAGATVDPGERKMEEGERKKEREGEKSADAS